jgi:hypothetical protein
MRTQTNTRKITNEVKTTITMLNRIQRKRRATVVILPVRGHPPRNTDSDGLATIHFTSTTQLWRATNLALSYHGQAYSPPLTR